MLGVGQNRFLDFLYIKDCLQLRHSLLKGSLFQRAYEDACQIAHSVGHSRVELTSAKLIDRIGQQARNVLCGSKRVVRCVGRQDRRAATTIDSAGSSRTATILDLRWIKTTSCGSAGSTITLPGGWKTERSERKSCGNTSRWLAGCCGCRKLTLLCLLIPVPFIGMSEAASFTE